MLELTGDILTYEEGNPKVLRCFTSNAVIKVMNDLVMGAGIAKEFRDKWPTTSKFFGLKVKYYGNHVYIMEELNIANFPTKNHFKDPSIPELIEQSCKELVEKSGNYEKVLLTRPGCGMGKMTWPESKAICEKYFTSDKFIIMEKS